MKKFFLINLFSLVLCCHASAGGKIIGNGGNGVAMEFSEGAKEAIEWVTRRPGIYPELRNISLEKVLASTLILVSGQPLLSVQGGVTQYSMIINYHDPDTIVIHVAGWQAVKGEVMRSALALHEVLSLAGLESTGNYLISKRYLGERGDPCPIEKGLCEDAAPEYKCDLKHFGSAGEVETAPAAVFSGQTGGFLGQVLRLRNGVMEASILIGKKIGNTNGPSENYIELSLYQNQLKVSSSVLRDASYPRTVWQEWKDPARDETWAISCVRDGVSGR